MVETAEDIFGIEVGTGRKKDLETIRQSSDTMG